MSEEVARNGLLSRVVELIGDELQEVEDIFFRELRSRHPFVTDILSHVTHFRGKRLRPILLLLTAQAAGGINANHKVLAAVVEMIHTATLVHDDVLDDAETRRHVATVNTRWSNETSVLFGDYLFTHAFHLASSLETTQACRWIGHATNIVCEGELSQVHERGNIDLSEETYLRIIDGKTAELCAVACRLGAHYAGVDDAAVDALEEYGRSLGVAFQIADDLLDILGDEKATGKSLGSDLKKQKLTLPLIRLMQTAKPTDAARIRELLSEPNGDTVAMLTPWLRRSDAMEYTMSRAQEFAVAALEQLTCLPESPAKRMLEEVAEFTTQRTF